MAADPLEHGATALTLLSTARVSRLRVSRQLVALALVGAFAAPALARAQDPTPPTVPAPSPSPATTPDSLSPDSLAARLARAEAAIAALRQQLATESQSTVHTRSRLQLDLTGRLLTNFFLTLGRANNVDVPITALAPSADEERDAFGVTVRQSRLGAILTVAEVLGGTFVGDVELDFFGGVQNGPGDRRLFPEPRLRTTRARLRWSRTEIMVGSDVPLISGLNPVSLVASGTPNFSGSGNLWNWLGQIRLGQELGATSIGATQLRWALQGAIMAPYAGAQYAGEPDAEDAGERSTRPAFEGRFRAQWGDTAQRSASDVSIGEGGGEIGLGVHRGWVARGDGELETSYAVALDARISLGARAELRGEAYTAAWCAGWAAAGSARRSVAPSAPSPSVPPSATMPAGDSSTRRWPVRCIAGTGCGYDAVNDDDRPTRRRNRVCAAHLLWRPSEPVVLGLEFRGIETKFDTGAVGRVNHVNLGVGFEL